MHIERAGNGYVVHYAIADVAAFVTPGDPVDVEADRRGETLYGANSKVPLHPPVLSEGAASLLPDQVCPALLWTIEVDETGEGTDVEVQRALRSRAQLTYEGVQADLDAGRADELVGLLQEVGELRLAREAARGGVSLPLPEQELVEEDGHWELEFRRLTPVESWNAQISLLAGMAAASLMVYARVGFSARCRRPTRVTSSGCTVRPAPWASSGRPSSSTPTSSAPWTRRSRPTRRWSWPAPGCSVAPATSPSTASCPSRRSTRRSPRSTPTSPRPCAGWWTATPARSASHCVRAPTYPPGSSPRWPSCPAR